MILPSMPAPDLIASIPLFHALPADAVERLRAAASARGVAKGEIIFRQGDLPEDLLIVERGSVEIVLDTPAGEVVLATLREGAFFGELAIFEHRPRTASARAAEESRLVSIPRTAILDLIATHPPAAVQFLAIVAGRLRGADELLARLQVKNVNALMEARLTFGDRVADQFARFGGSWRFILLFGFFLILWAILNTTWLIVRPPDPFPYIFLNVVLNVISAAQAPFIMMSQNRQAEKDRLAADQAFQVALRTELAIRQIQKRLDERDSGQGGAGAS